jgi:hypothetical protein
VLELKEVQQDLIVEIGIMSKADNDYLITVSRVFSLAKRAKKIFESSEIPEKRQFINYLIQNPTLNNNKLSFTVTEPFKLILNLSDNPVWLVFTNLLEPIFSPNCNFSPAVCQPKADPPRQP